MDDVHAKKPETWKFRNKNQAIPMPYIPSTSATPTTVSHSLVAANRPGSTRSSEINIDLLTERRSSFELKPPSSLSKNNNNDDYHSTAVVKYSSLSDPTPLSKLAKQTNLNRPPSNWLKDNPSSKGKENNSYIIVAKICY